MGRRRALALPLLLLLGACTHRGRAHDASSSAAASVGPEGGVRLLGDVAAPAFSPQLLDAARELAERRQAELAVRREQALELFNRAEARRACRADAFPHRRGSPKRRAAADAGGGAAVDPREIVALYRQAAALRAGPGSAAAAGTLARMCEWGWDGVGDLSRYEPAGLRRAAAGGGGGGGTAGAALEGWHEALLATSAGAWASEHVPGLRALVTWLGGVDVRAALQSLWAPLGGGAGHHHDAHSAGAAAPLGDPAAAATAGAPMVVPHNMSCAVEWYATAAGLGNASAQFVMGVLHMHGLFGVRPSAPAALAQWVFAALGGSLDAATALGLRHATGDGVPKSCASAVSYLEAPARARADAVAASAGLLQAAPSPTHTRLTDTAYESLHSESLRGEGQVVTYYHTAAERGDTNAHVALAHLYLLGVRGVVQDLPAAAEHFHAAAEAAEPLSLANLGYMYLHGLGVERNPTLAREFLKVPVEAGLPAAVTTLAFMYVTGQGAERDAATAAALLKRAADAGHADAHYNLGMLHLEGFAPAGRDLRLAAHHFKAAATGGHVQGAHALGVMAAHGLGGPVDCASALAAFRGVLARLPLSHHVANGHELLAAGKPAGAVLAYLTAGELGQELGVWNAAWLLDRGLVPGAAPEHEEDDDDRAAPEGEAVEGAEAAAQQQQQPGETLAGGAFSTQAPAAREARPASAFSELLAAHWWLAAHAARAWRSTARLVRPWLLPARRSSLSPPGARRRALRLFARSAAAGNTWADVVLADAHLYGVGGLPVDAPGAAERYLAACAGHVPDACFAMGWLYETGTGLAADWHLAKRYYDLALEHQAAHRLVGASAPVKLMLARLAARQTAATAMRDVVLPLLRRQ